MYHKYIGKKCPFCHAPFSEHDDIIVCSSCDMPHHKDCWVQNGACTTFGCLGTIQAVSMSNAADSVTSDQMDFEPLFSQPAAPQPTAPQPTESQPTPQQSTVYCTRCGTPNRADGNFCVKCGSPLRTAATQQNVPPRRGKTYAQQYAQHYEQSKQGSAYGQQTPYQTQSYSSFLQIQEQQMDERLQFVGIDKEYYAKVFSKMIGQHTTVSWNWGAFFFGPFWLLFRRMYQYGIGYLSAMLALTVIGDLLVGVAEFDPFFIESVTSLLSIGGCIALGIWGNYLYMKRIDTLCAQTEHMSPMNKKAMYDSHGGTNFIAAIGITVGFFCLAFLLGLIF